MQWQLTIALIVMIASTGFYLYTYYNLEARIKSRKEKWKAKHRALTAKEVEIEREKSLRRWGLLLMIFGAGFALITGSIDKLLEIMDIPCSCANYEVKTSWITLSYGAASFGVGLVLIAWKAVAKLMKER